MVDNIKEELEIINDFINENFIELNDYENCINCIDKLNRFLNKRKIEFKVDGIIELLTNNDNFKNCIDTIFEKNKVVIISGYVDDVFNNTILTNIIDVYCMMNGIEVNNPNADYEIDSVYLEDGMSAYIQEIKNYRLLTYEEEKMLGRRKQAGDKEARDIFIKHNLKLVVSIAYRYLNRGLSLQDLVQEGNIGLMIAVEKFDPDKGFRLSTYAYNWIKQGITRALANDSKIIRIPVYMGEKYNIYSYKN